MLLPWTLSARLISRQWWPELVAAAAFVASVALMRGVPIGHDAVWQMWIARQLAHGTRLYSDLLEVNPPLWFWMAIPLQDAAEVIGGAPREFLKGAFFGSLALSLTLIALLRPGEPRVRAGMYLGLLVAATIVVLPDFAQREQYTLLASAPWVVLVAVRVEQRAVPGTLAVLVGVFAATGLALKPHFAIIPLALEGWLAIRMRSLSTLWRPELLVFAGCATAYAAVLGLLAPDYFRVMAPLVFLSYGDFGHPPFFFQLFQLAVPLTLLALLGLYLGGGLRTKQGEAALIASLSFLACYFAQYKGWRYHTIPALGMLFMLIGSQLAGLRWSVRHERSAIMALSSAILLGIIEPLYVGSYANRTYPAAERALAGLQRGDSVMVFAVGPFNMWPIVEDLGLLWPSRMMSSWFLPAVVRGMQDNNLSPALASLSRTIRSETLKDLLCHPPKRILVDDQRVSVPGRSLPYDYLDFYRADPLFARFLDRYRPGPTFGHFFTLDLVDLESLKSPAGCRSVF